MVMKIGQGYRLKTSALGIFERVLRISAQPAPCFGVNRQVISVSGGLLLGA
jgi:hypothetical protein